MGNQKLLPMVALICIAFPLTSQHRLSRNIQFWKDTICQEDFGVKIAAPLLATGFSANVVTDFVKKTRMQFQLGMLYAGSDTAIWIYNLFNGHGNAALNFLRPIFISKMHNTANYLMGSVYNRNSTLLPGQSGSSQRLLGSLESGISLLGHLAGDADAIRLTGEYRLGGSWHNLFQNSEFAHTKRLYLAHMFQLKIESHETSLSFAFPLGISGFKYKLPFFFGFSQTI